MIKTIIFDLDGVLADLKDCHYNSLNKALSEIDDKFIITQEEHLSLYDGLPTKDKLKLLTINNGLLLSDYEFISERKQYYTINYIQNNINIDNNLIEVLSNLKKENYKIIVASNSIKNTIYTFLVKADIIHYIDVVYSNQDVIYSKPNSEIYLKAIQKFGNTPQECLIIEDSPHGITAALNSGANVLRVSNPNGLTLTKIISKIDEINNNKLKNMWDGSEYNILIPMAGAGSRFQRAGFDLPKPLINVNGKPMIQLVVENLNIKANFIYVVQKEHYKKYNLEYILNLLTPNCKIIQVDSLTEGAACTTLLAKDYINNDKHLIIANLDQFIEWDSNWFYYNCENNNIDGSIVTFHDNNPKWSYAKVDDHTNNVIEVAEKNPISNNATVGIYYYKHGYDYVKYAEQMINKNIRVNNEFYVCPIYNEFILDNKIIKTYNIKKMWGIGIPEDLKYYLENYKN
jgi:HAD superfamily hydrolase (TIGR01509 family)